MSNWKRFLILSNLQWAVIFLMMGVFFAIGIHQIATTLEMQKLVKELEGELDQKQSPEHGRVPHDFETDSSSGYDERNDVPQVSVPEADMSSDAHVSSESLHDSVDFIQEAPLVESTSSQAAAHSVSEETSENMDVMDRHLKNLEDIEQTRMEGQKFLEENIPMLITHLNSMTSEEQKNFFNQMETLFKQHSQEAEITNFEDVDETIVSFIEMLKEKGFQSPD